MKNRTCGADLISLPEVGFECIAHRAESVCHPTIDLRRHATSSQRASAYARHFLHAPEPSECAVS